MSRESRHLTEPPEIVLLEGMFEGSRAIENQEKRGQQRLAKSGMLPVRVNYGSREQFEAMGIRFHDDKADDLFVPVDLPEGWGIKPTDHSMWSKLVDDRGRERASIFYKAAFYDRDAFLNIVTRFQATFEPVGGWDGHVYGETPMQGLVKDGGVIVWTGEACSDGPDYEWSAQATADASAWLAENYPNWRDPLAYWDP